MANPVKQYKVEISQGATSVVESFIYDNDKIEMVFCEPEITMEKSRLIQIVTSSCINAMKRYGITKILIKNVQ